MKRVACAGAIVLLSLSLAYGGAAPRKADVPKYVQMLKAAAAKDRAKAAEMLGKRGAVNIDDVASAIEPLKGSLKDDDASVRKEAALALGLIRPEPTETVPLLTDVVKNDKVFDVKMTAAHALGLYGADAKSAMSAIRGLTAETKDKQTGRQVQMILAKINGKKK